LIGICEGRLASFLFLRHNENKMLAMFHRKFPNAKQVEFSPEDFTIYEKMREASKCKTKRLEFLKNNAIITGTPFQEEVWGVLARLDCITCYQKVAQIIGREESARAVGLAVGANALHLIVPCHLIVKKNGDVGNYAGGSDLKKRLIDDL